MHIVFLIAHAKGLFHIGRCFVELCGVLRSLSGIVAGTTEVAVGIGGIARHKFVEQGFVFALGQHAGCHEEVNECLVFDFGQGFADVDAGQRQVVERQRTDVLCQCETGTHGIADGNGVLSG